MVADACAELTARGIAYEKFEHEAVFTVPESVKLNELIPGAHTKNLFLEAEPTGKLYLLTVSAEKRVDLKKLARELGERRFSFGKAELLLETLGLTPGSVSPLGLLNDSGGRVTFLLDGELAAASTIAVHPNRNTATLVIATGDFKSLVASIDHPIHIVSV